MASSGTAIFGITGRMGQCLVRALREEAFNELHLCGALASPHSQRLGLDATGEGLPTGVIVTADLTSALQGAAVAVDFSRAECVAGNAAACANAGVALLVGTTGLDDAARAALTAAARVVPVLVAPNTSIGVSVMLELVARATQGLGESFDIEISESHHRSKRDAPSGTALALGAAVAGARGQQLADVAVYGRYGVSAGSAPTLGMPAPRAPGGIGFAVSRGGDIVGEHTVTFAGDGERLEMTHRATDRMTFARGALRAAQWLCGRSAGTYRMGDLFGIDSHATHR